MTDLSFSGRVALITGAASGIGKATAHWLAARDIARLILIDLNGDALDRVALECPTLRLAGDVGDAALWERIEADVPRIDHALLNAGVPPSCTEIAETSIENWRRVINVNLDGVFLGLRTAIRAMKAHGGGSVVLTSSAAGVRALPNTADYAAAKAGVIHLARCAALEYAKHGIRVNAIAPGGVDTGIWDTHAAFQQALKDQGASRDAVVAAMGAEGTPRGKWATPDELADNIGFLLSDMAANITGTLMISDGGITL